MLPRLGSPSTLVASSFFEILLLEQCLTLLWHLSTFVKELNKISSISPDNVKQPKPYVTTPAYASKDNLTKVRRSLCDSHCCSLMNIVECAGLISMYSRVKHITTIAVGRDVSRSNVYTFVGLSCKFKVYVPCCLSAFITQVRHVSSHFIVS